MHSAFYGEFGLDTVECRMVATDSWRLAIVFLFSGEQLQRLNKRNKCLPLWDISGVERREGFQLHRSTYLKPSVQARLAVYTDKRTSLIHAWEHCCEGNDGDPAQQCSVPKIDVSKEIGAAARSCAACA